MVVREVALTADLNFATHAPEYGNWNVLPHRSYREWPAVEPMLKRVTAAGSAGEKRAVVMAACTAEDGE